MSHLSRLSPLFPPDASTQERLSRHEASSTTRLSRHATCEACTVGHLCINGEPKLHMQERSCPKGHWTSLPDIYWLVGDLAKGGITNFLKTIIPSLPNHHFISLASDFSRDTSAFPSIRPGIFPSEYVPAVYPAPPGSLVRVDPSPVRIVHLVSRHPSHTPLTPEESQLLANCKVYVHAHGPGIWAQECIDYAASLLGLTAPPTLLCNSRYTFQNLRLPYGWQSTIIPLPLRPSYSPYSRYEDREHTSSLVRSGPRPDPKRNWCIYTGRCSPEKNLPALSHLCSQAGIELLIATADVPSVSCYHIPWTDDLTRIYNAADFCICTSTSEGGPIFAAEALLQGCTVLSTPVGHMPDLLPPARILHSLEAVPDILRRPHSLERSSEDIILAFHAAKFFASSLPQWLQISR